MASERFDNMDVENAAAVSSRAIQSMAQLSVPATPSNYVVWFHYILGTSPRLQKTIDILLGNKRKFDAAINNELYKVFGVSRQGGDDSSSQQVASIIDRARQFLGTAIVDNKAQIAILSDVAEQVTEDSDPRPIIEILMSELEKANSRAAALELNFTETAQQLGEVRLSLERAEMQSRTDALTGLANRRALDDFFRTSMIRAMETGDALSAFMIDVDHFKKFNDAHGHHVGDQVLRLIAKVLQDCIREDDLAARYGGEELVAVLPGADLDASREIADRVRRRICDAKLTKRNTGQEVGKVTVSIGIAQFRPGEPVEAWIERCDRGLYRAKHQGRNRIITEVEVDGEVAA